MLASIGLGRRIDSPLTTTPQHQPIVIHSTKNPKRTSSSSITDDNESVNISHRSRHCYSPIRPSSLILSSQNSSQKTHSNDQVIDDENEKYYSAQSSKISTPMAHSIGGGGGALSSYIKTSNEKLFLSSILDIDSEEQKKS
jgi:hypothetical protein